MKTENQPIDNHDFDLLLMQTLLSKEELYNDLNNEIMANQLFSTTSSIPAIDNVAIREKLQFDFTSASSKWRLNLLILLSIVTVISCAFWMFQFYSNSKVITQSDADPIKVEELTMVSAEENREQRVRRSFEEIVLPVIADSLAGEVELENEPITPALFNYGNTYMHIPEPFIEEDTEVPLLSESDKKQNNKAKLQMLKDIAKRKSYLNQPAGTAFLNGVTYPVSPFAMKGSEVTNWEYNVFLNDLVMQARTDEYLAAKPVKGNWKAIGIAEFEDTYAYNDGYRTHPAVNMSRKAAELYCSWLTTSMKEAIANKDVKWSGPLPVFRLPSNLEWVYAARGSDSTMQYPWGKYYNSTQNARGCYLCNFNWSVSKNELAPEGPSGSKGCISMKPNTRSIITTAGRSIDTLVLAPVYSYNPSNSGMYCMMGNVSEMVWTYQPENRSVQGAARSLGGSWNSHVSNVKIDAPEQYEGKTDASPMIGFRPVMIIGTE